ncbi:hypothetical protein [Flavobacterium sp. CAU 1735]|uniref:hypothetical protein n=1 Tax=Flavobacterium sp. CAU 1735 TaxID=3140361 RepID=UPI00326148F1
MMTKKQFDTLSFILSIVGIISLIFFAIGLKNIENYTNWLLFTIVSVIFGIFLALLIHHLLCFFEPKIRTYKNAKGIKMLHQLVFSFILLSFGLMRFVNEYKINKTDCKTYKIIDLGKSGSKNPTHYIFINGKNGEERLSFGKSYNQKHKVGDSINLCIHKGFLGFNYYKPTKK